MADKSNIEWTDASWTPIRARNRANGKVGWHCEHVSPGCELCYAGVMNERRFGTGLPFKPGHRKDVEIFLDETMLLQPLRWKKRRKIFVCSMTDLFADFVPDEFIDRVFAVMALAPQHQFQVLTKRAARMREYMTSAKPRIGAMAFINALRILRPTEAEEWRHPENREWPLPNVWLGVSAEDQRRADERIPHLLETPAAKRFVSAEPLLGPVDLTKFFHAPIDMAHGFDWVIVGGESGSGARPMHPDWARSIRDQCQAAGVPFFFKQWGEWAPWDDDNWSLAPGWSYEDVARRLRKEGRLEFLRVGKKSAGRMLDGREHSEWPEVKP